jgi:anti-sigma28 factor (negative regulator of flagellin synthesis)
MKINRNELERIYNSILKESHPTVEKDRNQKIQTGKDSLVLSDKAKGYSGMDGLVQKAANEAVKSAQAERLLRLKSAVSNGTYYVPGSSIAEAMLTYSKRSEE